ncbi:MAG TPA: thiamine phosphate synthase [Terracidiphilus sp.]|nr:thiamine phosphate synthase [Terracidiphilus sp.]
MQLLVPKVYPILDSSYLPSRGRAAYLQRLATSLAAAGVSWLEYRNKTGNDAEILSDASLLRASMPAPNIKLILDDRVDLVDIVDFDGVHVDSGDLTPAEARRRLGPNRIVGTFGGSEAMVPGVLSEPADYFSIGPVYPTTTKQTTKNPIGPEGVRKLRAEAGPNAVLVAAGGMTLETAARVLEAGATSVAVSAAIFRVADPSAELRRWIQSLG